LEVVNGVFSAVLGKQPMKPFFYELLNLYPDAILKSWVNTGTGFVLMREQALTLSQVEDMDKFSAASIDSKEVDRKPAIGLSYADDLDKKIEKREAMKKDDPAFNPDGLRWERWKKRADENGYIPIDALTKAKRHMDAMPPIPSDDAGLWAWEWIGPGNIGGRIRAICIHPTNTNTIFIGGIAGGIWRSTNGGATWSAINDFLPNLAISSIVIDPTNTNNMYASTGEGFGNSDGLPGAGIFKSTNGGSTWSQLASTDNDNFKWVSRLEHHPDSTNVLYAVTSWPGRVYKTKNGGTTWISVLSTSSDGLDVKINPNNVARVVVGCSNDVYTSDNYGRTWTNHTTGAANKLPNDPGRCEVTYCRSNVNRIYVSANTNSGEIWRSDDNGATWSQRCTGYDYLGTQGWYDNCIWVDPTNSNLVVVGGIDAWRSTDGGATLTRISRWQNYHNGGSANSAHADHHIIINHPDYDGSTNKTVFFGNDGGIQKATDISTVAQTSGWTNLCNTTLGITQFYGGSSAPDGSKIIGGTQDNDVVRYRSSGAWSGPTGWYQDETGDGGYCAIDFSNTNTFYTEYTTLVIEKSTNGGDTYTSATSGLTDAGSRVTALFIAPFSMDPNNSSRLIAGGSSIWRTTNGAGSWSSIKGTTGTGYWAGATWRNHSCSAIDIADGNSDIIWVGYENGYVYKCTNGTNASPTWTRVDNNATAIPDRWVADIAINPFNHNEVFVTLGGYNNNNVWFTTDGGTTWNQRTGTAPNDLPALPVNSIRFHPTIENWIYIGTDLGVFSSEDKGASWSVNSRYDENEGPCNVEVDELFWQGDEFLIAATHGRGMYRAHPLSVIYVDAAAAAGGDGSAAKPYQTVEEAINNAGWGTAISIKSNTYNETNGLLFYKKGMIYSTNGSSIIK
jgi:hypothetical protein